MDKVDFIVDPISGQRLTETNIKVYKWAVTRENVSLHEATDALGLTTAEAKESMEVLVAVQLMELTSVGDALGNAAPEIRWRVLNPQVAAARLAAAESRLRQLMVELHSSRRHFDALFNIYSILGSVNNTQNSVEALGSLSDVISLIDEASTGCKVEMISCQPGGGRPPEQLEEAVARDVELLERGVRMRTMYQHSARHHPPTRTYVDRITAAGAEVRTSTELFGRLIVFDRMVAFIPHHAVSGGAAVIREPSVISFLCNAFDHAWELATPFSEARLDTAAPSDLHQNVLRLLSEGVRDETIARRLGVSLRTCRKYIAEIFDELGAKSRFQAGYLTGHRGMLK